MLGFSVDIFPSTLCSPRGVSRSCCVLKQIASSFVLLGQALPGCLQPREKKVRERDPQRSGGSFCWVARSSSESCLALMLQLEVCFLPSSALTFRGRGTDTEQSVYDAHLVWALSQGGLPLPHEQRQDQFFQHLQCASGAGWQPPSSPG